MIQYGRSSLCCCRAATVLSTVLKLRHQHQAIEVAAPFLLRQKSTHLLPGYVRINFSCVHAVCSSASRGALQIAPSER